MRAAQRYASKSLVVPSTAPFRACDVPETRRFPRSQAASARFIAAATACGMGRPDAVRLASVVAFAGIAAALRPARAAEIRARMATRTTGIVAAARKRGAR